MKRLFIIKDTYTGSPVKGLFFDNKMDAKAERDRRNKELGRQQYVVSYGPDHYKMLKEEA